MINTYTADTYTLRERERENAVMCLLEIYPCVIAIHIKQKSTLTKRNNQMHTSRIITKCML